MFEAPSGDLSDPWDLLCFFCDKTKKHVCPSAEAVTEFNLLSMHSPFLLTSWNCTSLRASRDNSWKFTYIRRRCRAGLVSIQETKLRRGDPAPVEALVSLVHIVRSHASTTEVGGASGGLAFFVPGQLGYVADRARLVEVVPGFIAALPVSFGGISWMVWNIYLHPRRRKHLLQSWHEHLCASQAAYRQFVHVYAGDLNHDGESRQDMSLQQLLDQVHSELRLESLRPPSCTYRRSGSDCSSIDACGTPMLRQGKFGVQWSCSADALSVYQGHLPVCITGSLSCGGATYGMARHRRLHADLFLRECPAKVALREHMARATCAVGLRYDDILDSIRRQPITGRAPPFEGAQRVADDACMRLNPMQLMRLLEAHIYLWSRSPLGGRPLRRSLLDCLTGATASTEGVDVPIQAWMKAHQVLDLAVDNPQDLCGDFVRIEHQQHAALLGALRLHYGRSTDEPLPRNAGHAVHDQFRRLLPRGASCEARLSGPQGVTSDPREMDELYASARSYAQQPPVTDPSKQLDVLRYYVRHVVGSRRATACLLSVAEIHDVICHLPDTAPGMGGVPYAAWRVDPLLVACIYRTYLIAMCRDPDGTFKSTPERVQLVVYIGKKVPSLSPVDRRPLGLSATFIRILSALAYIMLKRCLQPLLHQSQVLACPGADGLAAAIAMQDLLDGSEPIPAEETHSYSDLPSDVREFMEAGCVEGLALCDSTIRVANLADFQQAFERVSLDYVRDVLCCWQLPVWLIWLTWIFLSHRFSRILLGRVMGIRRPVLIGVDIGTQVAPFLYIVGLDPMLCMASVLPGISILKAYMDDVAAGGSLRGSLLFQRLVQYFTTVGPLLTVQHTCWQIHCAAGQVHVSGLIEAWRDRNRFVRCLHTSGREVWLSTSDTTSLPFVHPANCECKSKLTCVVSRQPHANEWRALYTSVWGPQVVHGSGEYLGIWITGRDLWEETAGIDVDVWRTERNYAKALAKLDSRVRLFRSCRLSGPLCHITWGTYCMSVFSYVASYLLPTARVLCAYMACLRMHFRFAGVVSDMILASVGAFIGHWSSCYDLTGYAVSMCASRHARALGSQWVHHRHDHSFIGRILRTSVQLVDAAAPDAPRGVAKSMQAFLQALDGNRAVLPRQVGRIVRWAFAWQSVRIHGHSVRSRLSRWPSAILADVSLTALREGSMSLHAKWAALRWLLDGNATALRFQGSRQDTSMLRCRFCTVQVVPTLFPFGRTGPGLCSTHYDEFWESAGGVTGVVYASRSAWGQTLRTCLPDLDVSAAPIEQFDVATIDGSSPICLACGCGVDDCAHRLCWCPVVQISCRVALRQPWSFNALAQVPVAHMAQFLSAVHSWFPGLQPPESQSSESLAWCMARVRSLLGHWWAFLDIHRRPENVRRCLQSLGVQIAPRARAVPSTFGGRLVAANAVSWLRSDGCNVAAASTQARHIARLVAGCFSLTGMCMCSSCRGLAVTPWRVRRAIVGSHLLRAAPRLDTGSYRWVSIGLVDIAQCLAQWVQTADGVDLLYEGRSPPVVRQAGIGLDYNVVIHSHLCSCGVMQRSVVAARPVVAGEELLSSASPHAIASQGSLLLTTDGGGSSGNVGCAVVGFFVALGRYTHLDTIIVPMPGGETPQEAEAHGLYSAVLARPYFFRKALELGLCPSEPDYIASDSRNTVRSSIGIARLRQHRLQQWAAGVLAAMDYHARRVEIFQTPRSANAAADHGAGVAVQLVRDMTNYGADVRPLSALALPYASGRRLSCALFTPDRFDLVAFNRSLDGVTVRELEATGWRSLLIDALRIPHVSHLPFSGSVSDTLSTLEWAASVPTISHAGLYLACHVYLRRSPPNHKAHQYVRAFALSAKHAAECSSVTSWVFTWYSVGSTMHGRVQDRTPGMLSLPSAVRWAFFGNDHSEWDISLCHLSVFVSLLEPGEGDDLVAVWKELCTLEGRARIEAGLPAGKNTFMRVLNSHDANLPGSSFERWWRMQSKRPSWFLHLVDIMVALRPRVLARLRSRGFTSQHDGVTVRNEVFFALSAVEATVVRSCLAFLREDFPIFSHGLVHDAVYIRNTVSAAAVEAAFQRAAHKHGFPCLTLSRKTWDKARAKATLLLQQSGYRHDARIQCCQLPSRTSNLNRYMVPTVDNLWLSYVRIPKSAQ